MILILNGIRLFNLNIRGKSVLLKPNLVEYIPGRPVNTDGQVIGAATKAFLRLGAASVVVSEGPGHHRDTDLLLCTTGLADQLKHRKIPFVDLNRDELIKTKLQANVPGVSEMNRCAPTRRPDRKAEATTIVPMRASTGSLEFGDFALKGCDWKILTQKSSHFPPSRLGL